MKKRILSVLISTSLLFGTVVANAVSINFEELETDDILITYEDLEAEETVIQDTTSPLATEISDIEKMIIEPELIESEPHIQNYALRNSTFDITLTANTEGYGSVSLDWSGYDYRDKNFKVYKSDDGGVTYETVGIDYTLVDEVKCLQIYPISSASNQLKTWMETNGYGKEIIKIDSVYYVDFNKNADSYLKDSNGEYKYDVIFFGTWDGNNGMADLTNKTKSQVENYIKTGRGCIVGHDIISYRKGHSTYHGNKNSNWNSLASYFGITFHDLYNGLSANQNSNLSNRVKITKKGLFTTYPWYIGEVGTVLTIPQAHNVGQRINTAKKWLEFCNSSALTSDSNNNFYLATNNNCGNIMTGHSDGQATVDEQKIIANLIFYCNQLIFDTWYSKDSSAQDFANPNAPTANVSGSNFTWSATDNGSTYHYFVQSFDKNDTTETGLLDTSVTKSLTVTTGVRKYRYILDNSSSTTVTLSNGTETTATSIPENRSYSYLHIAAIDGAGNIGPTTTVEIPKTANVTVNHYKMNLDGSTYTLAETATTTGTIGNSVTPAVKTYTGFSSPAVQTKNIASGGITINYYYTRNNYTVTYIDRITGTTTQLGTSSIASKPYGSTVRGADKGNNTAVSAYYTGYYYASDTNTIVTTSGAIVYRYFTPQNYTVTYIDVIDSKSGKELGRSTASKPYNSTVRGADKGSSTADNAYYNGYYYVSDTSATVTTSGATVYRIFKQRMNTIAGNIIWEDWNNKNLSRPENVNLYISGSDGSRYSYVITGNHSQNTSVNRWPYSYDLPKYDSNGNVIVYTVSQDKAISQEKGLSYQEPLINGYDITNKITNMIINTEDYFQIPVTITWDDENDSCGFRPENITIQLLRNGEVIKTADGSDSYTFTELLKYDENGDKYVYTIQASDEKRYTKVENNSAPYNKTVTYTFVKSSFSVLIPKVIVLDGNQGNADYDITVNGAFYYNDTLTVKPANSFTMTDRSNISQMKANILQSKQSFMKSDIASSGGKTIGSIQVDRTNFAGLWTGTFNFDIKFVMQN